MADSPSVEAEGGRPKRERKQVERIKSSTLRTAAQKTQPRASAVMKTPAVKPPPKKRARAKQKKIREEEGEGEEDEDEEEDLDKPLATRAAGPTAEESPLKKELMSMLKAMDKDDFITITMKVVRRKLEERMGKSEGDMDSRKADIKEWVDEFFALDQDEQEPEDVNEMAPDPPAVHEPAQADPGPVARSNPEAEALKSSDISGTPETKGTVKPESKAASSESKAASSAKGQQDRQSKDPIPVSSVDSERKVPRSHLSDGLDASSSSKPAKLASAEMSAQKVPKNQGPSKEETDALKSSEPAATRPVKLTEPKKGATVEPKSSKSVESKAEESKLEASIKTAKATDKSLKTPDTKSTKHSSHSETLEQSKSSDSADVAKPRSTESKPSKHADVKSSEPKSSKSLEQKTKQPSETKPAKPLDPPKSSKHSDSKTKPSNSVDKDNGIQKEKVRDGSDGAKRPNLEEEKAIKSGTAVEKSKDTKRQKSSSSPSEPPAPMSMLLTRRASFTTDVANPAPKLNLNIVHSEPPPNLERRESQANMYRSSAADDFQDLLDGKIDPSHTSLTEEEEFSKPPPKEPDVVEVVSVNPRESRLPRDQHQPAAPTTLIRSNHSSELGCQDPQKKAEIAQIFKKVVGRECGQEDLSKYTKRVCGGEVTLDKLRIELFSLPEVVAKVAEKKAAEAAAMNKAMQDMSKMQIPRKAKPSAPPPPPPPPPPPTAPPPLDAAFGSGVSQANQESIQRDSRKRESGGSDGPGRHEADSKRRRSGERSRFSERRDESRVVQKPGETGQDLTPRSKVKNLEQYKGAQHVGHILQSWQILSKDQVAECWTLCDGVPERFRELARVQFGVDKLLLDRAEKRLKEVQGMDAPKHL